MTGRTLTRAHLCEAVYRNIGLSRRDSAMLVEAVLEELVGALETEDTVKISSFGTFSMRMKGKRTGRNPRTGEEVAIPPRRVIAFRASQLLKQRINAGRATMD
ncbi:MAG: integration host factor subunit alpha [Alphaproteobacteria bacterium]|nr:integration host factor subunit alpha [Alphaproteobacteria bacterium]MCY4317810.1 integration host factor subunit alpha [Alphaproteobacteria bacterium]